MHMVTNICMPNMPKCKKFFISSHSVMNYISTIRIQNGKNWEKSKMFCITRYYFRSFRCDCFLLFNSQKWNVKVFGYWTTRLGAYFKLQFYFSTLGVIPLLQWVILGRIDGIVTVRSLRIYSDSALCCYCVLTQIILCRWCNTFLVLVIYMHLLSKIHSL